MINLLRRLLPRQAIEHIYEWKNNNETMNRFKNEFNQFEEKTKEVKRGEFRLSWADRKLMLKDRTSYTSFDHHYVYHTAWAARILQEKSVTNHIDISSSLYFASIVSAFIPVTFYDYRPAALRLSQLETDSADLTKLLFDDDSISSLSCMHVVEHIGLGRYGDPINPNGDINAMNELNRVVKHSGSLLFVVPVGMPKIMFNAHRIYDPEMILAYFEDMDLYEFSCVLDSGEFKRKVSPSICENQQYACGMYHLIKRNSN